MKFNSLPIIFLLLTIFLQLVVCKIQIGAHNESFNYERLHKFGLGKRIIPNYRRINPHITHGYEYPGPMPTTRKTNAKPRVKYPYESYEQGRRLPGDVKVYSKEIDYKADYERGHHYFCEQVLDCIINYITVDTEGGIPIKLRGGAGYHYFAIIVKAHPSKPLIGRIEAYCVKENTDDGKTVSDVKTSKDGN